MAAPASSSLDPIRAKLVAIEAECRPILSAIGERKPRCTYQDSLYAVHTRLHNLSKDATALRTSTPNSELEGVILRVNELKYRMYAPDAEWQKMVLSEFLGRCRRTAEAKGDIAATDIMETGVSLAREYDVKDAGVHPDFVGIINNDRDGVGAKSIDRLASRIQTMLARMEFVEGAAPAIVATTPSLPPLHGASPAAAAAAAPAPERAVSKEAPSFVRNAAKEALYTEMLALSGKDLSAGNDQSSFYKLPPEIRGRVFGQLWLWSGSPLAGSSTEKMRKMSHYDFGGRVFSGAECDGITRKKASREVISYAIRSITLQLKIEEIRDLFNLSTPESLAEAKHLVSTFSPELKDLIYRETQKIKSLTSVHSGQLAFDDLLGHMSSTRKEKAAALHAVLAVLQESDKVISRSVNEFAEIDESARSGPDKTAAKREVIHRCAERLNALFTTRPFTRIETIKTDPFGQTSGRSVEALLFAYQENRPDIMNLAVMLLGPDLEKKKKPAATATAAPSAAASAASGGASATASTDPLDVEVDTYIKKWHAIDRDTDMLNDTKNGEKIADALRLALFISAKLGKTAILPTTHSGGSYMAFMADYARANPFLTDYFRRLAPGLRI